MTALILYQQTKKVAPPPTSSARCSFFRLVHLRFGRAQFACGSQFALIAFAAAAQLRLFGTLGLREE